MCCFDTLEEPKSARASVARFWANGRDADIQASGLVLKREDGGPGRSFPHEYRMHNRVLSILLENLSILPASTPNSKACLAIFGVYLPFSFVLLDVNSEE